MGSVSGMAADAGRKPGLTLPSKLELMVGVILERVGVMLDARLEALEERLPPERVFWPPLGVRPSEAKADSKTGAGTAGRGEKAPGGKKVGAVISSPPRGPKTLGARIHPSTPSPPLPADQAWSTVVGRKKGGKKAGAATTSAVPSSARPAEMANIAAAKGKGGGKGGWWTSL